MVKSKLYSRIKDLIILSLIAGVFINGCSVKKDEPVKETKQEVKHSNMTFIDSGYKMNREYAEYSVVYDPDTKVVFLSSPQYGRDLFPYYASVGASNYRPITIDEFKKIKNLK